MIKSRFRLLKKGINKFFYIISSPLSIVFEGCAGLTNAVMSHVISKQLIPGYNHSFVFTAIIESVKAIVIFSMPNTLALLRATPLFSTNIIGTFLGAFSQGGNISPEKSDLQRNFPVVSFLVGAINGSLCGTAFTLVQTAVTGALVGYPFALFVGYAAGFAVSVLLVREALCLITQAAHILTTPGKKFSSLASWDLSANNLFVTRLICVAAVKVAEKSGFLKTEPVAVPVTKQTVINPQVTQKNTKDTLPTIPPVRTKTIRKIRKELFDSSRYKIKLQIAHIEDILSLLNDRKFLYQDTNRTMDGIYLERKDALKILDQKISSFLAQLEELKTSSSEQNDLLQNLNADLLSVEKLSLLESNLQAKWEELGITEESEQTSHIENILREKQKIETTVPHTSVSTSPPLNPEDVAVQKTNFVDQFFNPFYNWVSSIEPSSKRTVSIFTDDDLDEEEIPFDPKNLQDASPDVPESNVHRLKKEKSEKGNSCTIM